MNRAYLIVVSVVLVLFCVQNGKKNQLRKDQTRNVQMGAPANETKHSTQCIVNSAVCITCWHFRIEYDDYIDGPIMLK